MVIYVYLLLSMFIYCYYFSELISHHEDMMLALVIVLLKDVLSTCVGLFSFSVVAHNLHCSFPKSSDKKGL